MYLFNNYNKFNCFTSGWKSAKVLKLAIYNIDLKSAKNLTKWSVQWKVFLNSEAERLISFTKELITVKRNLLKGDFISAKNFVEMNNSFGYLTDQMMFKIYEKILNEFKTL